MRRSVAAAVAIPLAVAALGLSACGGLENDTGAEQKAEQLVSKAHTEGLVPEMTVSDAATLYGNDAPTICARLGSSYTAGIANSLDTGPTTRTPTEVVRDTVRYARIVVSVYCPDQESDLQDLVKDWDLDA